MKLILPPNWSKEMTWCIFDMPEKGCTEGYGITWESKLMLPQLNREVRVGFRLEIAVVDDSGAAVKARGLILEGTWAERVMVDVLFGTEEVLQDGHAQLQAWKQEAIERICAAARLVPIEQEKSHGT